MSRRILGPPLRAGIAARVLALSPDGRRLAASVEPSAPSLPRGGSQTYDVSTGRARKLGDVQSNAVDAAFSSDGAVLYTSEADGVSAFDATTLQQIGSTYFSVFNTTGSVASASNGRGQSFVAVGFGRSVAGTGATLINATTNRVIADLGQPLNVTAVAMSHDASTVVLGGSDGTLTAWSTSGVGLTWPWRAQGGAIVAVSFAVVGERGVSTATDGSTALWTISGSGALALGPRSARALRGSPNGGGGIALSADGRRVAVTNADGPRSNLCEGPSSTPDLLSNTQACPDVPIISDTYVVVSDVNARTRQTTTAFRTEAGPGPGFNANGSPPAFASVRFDPTRRRIAVNDGSTVYSATAALGALPGLHGRPILGRGSNLDSYFLVASPSRGFATASTWISIDGWTGRRTGKFTPPPDPSGAIVDEQGRRAATMSDSGDIVVWDLRTGRPVGGGSLASRSTPSATAIAFSPSGDEIAVGRQDGTLTRYSVPSLRLLGNVLGGHGRAIGAVAYQPRGTIVAAASGDRVQLVDRATGTTIATIPFASGQSLSEKVPTVQFDSVGDVLLTQGDLTTRPALLWSMVPADWVSAACRAAGRNITRTEWTQFVGSDVPYHRTCAQWPAG